MGDCVGVQFPVIEIYLGLTIHPGQLSLVIPSWVGRMSTGDGLLATTGKKQRILRNQDCWHSGLVG